MTECLQQNFGPCRNFDDKDADANNDDDSVNHEPTVPVTTAARTDDRVSEATTVDPVETCEDKDADANDDDDGVNHSHEPAVPVTTVAITDDRVSAATTLDPAGTLMTKILMLMTMMIVLTIAMSLLCL